MKNNRRHNKIQVGAVILIVLGVLFLLSNLGVADFNLGNLLAKWWPIILIIVGVNMLLKRNGWWK